MNLTKLFCDIDDFCKTFEVSYNQGQITDGKLRRNRRGQLELSEVLTILVFFHQSQGYRNFKGYYSCYVLKYLKKEFPRAVSYSRFVELIPRAFLALSAYLNTRKGTATGIAFVDSTKLVVCDNHRIHSHKVFDGLAKRGKSSMGWFFGLKLHLVVNDQGEFLGIKVTPGNTDDREPVPEMVKGLKGSLFGDKGYISQRLFDELILQGLRLVYRVKKNMKKRTTTALDRLLLRKRAIIETINDLLKNGCHIEHTRHRSPLNAMVHLLAGLVAYSWLEKKPKIIIHPEDLAAFHNIKPNQKALES